MPVHLWLRDFGFKETKYQQSRCAHGRNNVIKKMACHLFFVAFFLEALQSSLCQINTSRRCFADLLEDLSSSSTFPPQIVNYYLSERGPSVIIRRFVTLNKCSQQFPHSMGSRFLTSSDAHQFQQHLTIREIVGVDFSFPSNDRVFPNIFWLQYSSAVWILVLDS